MLSKKITVPTDLPFSKSGMSTFRQIYCVKGMHFVLRFNLFNMNISHIYQTRSATMKKFLLPQQIFFGAQRHIMQVGPKLFNIIPRDLKLRLNKSIKINLKQWIITNFSTICQNITWFMIQFEMNVLVYFNLSLYCILHLFMFSNDRFVSLCTHSQLIIWRQSVYEIWSSVRQRGRFSPKLYF